MRLVKVRRPFPTRKPLRTGQIVDIEGWNFADRYVRQGHLAELTKAEEKDFLDDATPEVLERIKFVPTATPEAQKLRRVTAATPTLSDEDQDEDARDTETSEAAPDNSGLENSQDPPPPVEEADLAAAAKKQPVTKTAAKKKKPITKIPADNTESK